MDDTGGHGGNLGMWSWQPPAASKETIMVHPQPRLPSYVDPGLTSLELQSLSTYVGPVTTIIVTAKRLHRQPVALQQISPWIDWGECTFGCIQNADFLNRYVTVGLNNWGAMLPKSEF